MLHPGDISFCKKIKNRPDSNHWWIILYVDDSVVRYMIATSKVGPFVYREILLQDLQQPEQPPDAAVFLDIQKVIGADGSPIFHKPTILNCRRLLKADSLQTFNALINDSLLSRVGRLPDRYLAQIIPAARCGRWSRADIKQVLDLEHGIGGIINAFYDRLRQ